MQPRDGITIERGRCYAVFAYDLAAAINLNEAQRRLRVTQRDKLRHKRPAPAYFEYQPAPVRVSQTAAPLRIGAYATYTSVDLVLYDFGAVSVHYSIPLTGSLSDLLPLSLELYDNALLLADSRQRVEHLVSVLGSCLNKPGLADVVEDYIIFQLESCVGISALESLYTTYAPLIAQILRAEDKPLSQQEVADAVSYRLSFAPDDLTIVDWRAALLCDRAGEDVLSVLEFANVELLEMRYLDQRLDDALDRSYETLSRRLWRPFGMRRSYGHDLRHVARLQVDNAILFEGVNNALKLLGDQYLARVYRMISQRFHLAEWDASILRKLQTLESIYEKLADQAATSRMEMLEWVIIILIAVSIVLPFVVVGTGH